MSKTHPWSAVALIVLFSIGSVHGQDLWIDFNSDTQDNGPHNHPDYQSYSARHEVPEDFDTKEYAAFGTTVSFTPSWPDTTDNRVMQAIDRGTQGQVDSVTGEYSLVDEDGFPVVASWDFNWFAGDLLSVEEDMTGNIDVMTDWIGADSRPANGGNGNFDGQIGDPTRMLFTLTGVPAGEYNWVSFHHDTEFMHGRYWFDYSVDGGETFEPVGDREFTISKSTTGGNPSSPDVSIGFDDDFVPIDIKDLPSTVSFDFATTGQDVVMQFTPLSEIAVHTQFTVVNAFQLTQTAVALTCVVPPGGLTGDLDGSGDVAFADFLILSANFGAMNVSYGEGDIDCDGSVAFPDFLALSANFGQSGTAAQSVPEPGSIYLIVVAMLLFGIQRSKRAQ